MMSLRRSILRRLLPAVLLSILFPLAGCDRPEAAYSEFRISDPKTGIDLLVFGEMASMADCRDRSETVWDKVLRACDRCTHTSARCLQAMPERYAGLWREEPIHATYMVFERRDENERNGRLILFGVPSSAAARACEQLAQTLGRGYAGRIRCVQGSVG